MTGIHNVIVKPLSQLFNPIPCLFCAFRTPDTVEMEVHIEAMHPEWEDQLQYQSWKTPMPQTKKPNVAFVLADNVGYGDLGPYGGGGELRGVTLLWAYPR
jgi:hypothetical protein